MTLATELDLPMFDHTDPALRGARYDAAMAAIDSHDGWLAACPYGFIVLDREAGELFLRTREAVFPGLRIAELFSIDDGPLHREIVANIINRGGTDHSRLRRLVNPALTPRAVERYRPAMRRFAQELLDAVPDGRPIDFATSVARPYPALVIAHVMGAPLEDEARLHHWSAWVQRQFDAASLMTERAEIEREVSELYDYLDDLVARRRGAPGEDLISTLIAAEEGGEKLDHEELVNLILNLLVGGVDTSQSQLAHAVRLLASHPEAWERLREDPADVAPAVVEESLRFEPITPFTARMTTAEVEHRGVTFPAGTIVLVSAWHANRDIASGDGGVFDITRDDADRARLLTFGAGIHFCVGANLARAEITEALVVLAETMQRLEPAGEPAYGTPSGIYGLDSLPLVLSRPPEPVGSPAVSAA